MIVLIVSVLFKLLPGNKLLVSILLLSKKLLLGLFPIILTPVIVGYPSEVLVPGRFGLD